MANKTPTVLITGASGFLGSALVQHFAGKGWNVIGLVRNPKTQKRQTRTRYVQYDLDKPLEDSVFAGTDYLVHAAYIKQDAKHPEAFTQNVQAAEAVLQASRKHKLKKNVFISSMSSHEAAESVYGRQKLAIEKLFNTSHDLSLRPGLIVGNGGIVQSMAEFMRSKHLVPLIDGGKQPLQIIAIYDLVRAIELGLTSDVHGTLTVANPEVITYREFYIELKKYLHTSVLFVPVPYALLLGLLQLIRLLHIPLTIGDDNLRGLKMLRSVDNKADLKKLGIQPESLSKVLAKTHLS